MSNQESISLKVRVAKDGKGNIEVLTTVHSTPNWSGITFEDWGRIQDQITPGLQLLAQPHGS